LWYPGVGIYIAILGFLGVAVTMLRDVTKIGRDEKAIWIAVSTILLVLELHSISLDRRIHDEEQNEARQRQLRQFNTIVQQAQHHFDSTIDDLRTLLQNERVIRQNTAPRAVITLVQSQNVRFVSGDILKETVSQVWYTNIGNEDAAGLTYGGQVYVGTKDDLATQKELSKKFEFHHALNMN
jgi:hypothetical protein